MRSDRNQAWVRQVMRREPLPGSSSLGGGVVSSEAISISEPVSGPGAHAVPARRRAPFSAALRLMRPRQWIKNLLVVAAPGAAGALGTDHVAVRVLLACLAFCLLASGIYAVNDVRDVAEDRLHPRKRRRPVASGELSSWQALALGAGWMIAGLALCAAVRPLLALVGAGYVALTLSYSLVWRHVVVLDVLIIGCGFVLRAVAGGVAAPVTLSRWFLLVISAGAVFVAAAKRHSELRRTAGGEAARRRVLDSYHPDLLVLIMAAAVAVALVAYVMWAFGLPSVHGVPWRLLTIPPFAACLLRYVIRERTAGAETPEDVLLRDRPLQLAGTAWVVLFALGVHAAA